MQHRMYLSPRTPQPFRREERYYVLKISDMRKYLSAEKQEAVHDMAGKINAGRAVDGKAFLQAVVVEHDWPEYERVWQMLETRMTTTRAQPFNPNDDRRFWPMPFSKVKLGKFDVVRDAPETPEQAPVAWPCEIEAADFESDTITLKMQCRDYKISAGPHWLSTHPQPKREPLTDEIDRLRKALVYVAHELHATPQYMLAKGITLLDGDAVQVSINGWVVEASNKTNEATHGIKADI
ncbi:hypothetical protein [Limnohabitans sp.]|uniref:hypothetical protein n=1 Tax=Limnohabitans sp. TaxID=1907725 RepID=UPI00286F8AB2|nr:hypothetical protein [Limnohabitans sp.]